jgi:formylglycine-generating enzyme required for sulfatase activity
MTTPQIFISHSHHDNEFGLQIVQELRALLGEDAVWFDASGGLHGGEEWWDKIVAEITARPIFIVILSPEALASKWVMKEMSIAYRLHVELGHTLIPIMLTPCQRRADWALIQEISFVAPRPHAAAFAELCAVLAKYPNDADWQNRRTQIQTQIEGDRRAAAEAKAREDAARIALEQAERERRAREAQERRDKLVPQSLRTLGFILALNADVIIPPTVEVPAGPFTMGSDKWRDCEAQDDEAQVQVNLAAFRIGTFLMTVAEYACALAAKARGAPAAHDIAEPNNWAQQLQKPDHPVVYISWFMAVAYAGWLSKMTGETWRLPTEAEWEKAARGTDGRIYPWGDQWDKARANTSDGGPRTTTEVGRYRRYRRFGPDDPASDVSPYGASDMAGNVWEWTSSIYQQCYDIQSSENMSDRTSTRVLRGSAWNNHPCHARAAHRYPYAPDNLIGDLGARLVCVRAHS